MKQKEPVILENLFSTLRIKNLGPKLTKFYKAFNGNVQIIDSDAHVPYPMKYGVIEFLNDNKIDYRDLCKNKVGKDFFNLNYRDNLIEKDGADQYELLKKLCERSHGQLSLNVGFGKTVMIVYLIQHYIGKGKLLVCVNNNSVRDEIKSRLGDYCLSNYQLINPIGYMNSNKGSAALKNPSESEFKDVEAILIDECDSMNTSLQTVLNLCQKKQVVYGFSGTSDRFNGEDISTYKCMKKVNEDVIHIIERVGFSCHYKMSEKVLKLNIIMTDSIPEENPPEWYDNSERSFDLKLAFAYDNIFNSDVTYLFIQKILENKKDVAYVPIKKIEYGESIYNYFERSKYKVLLWHSGSFKCNDPDLNEKIKDLDTLKKYHGELDLLISTQVSYKGVDCPKLSDVGILFGTRSGITVQQIGRVFRHPTPVCWLLESTTNGTPFYNLSHRVRLKKIEKSYKIDTYYEEI